MQLWQSRLFRMSFATALALAVVAVGGYAAMTSVIGRLLETEASRATQEMAAELVQVHAQGGPPAVQRTVQLIGLPGVSVYGVALLADDRGAPLAGNLASWPRDVPLAPAPVVHFKHTREDGRPGRVHATVVALEPGLLLLVGRDPPELTRRATIVQATLWLSAAAALLLTFAAAWWLTARVEARLAGLSRVEADIGRSGILPRLPSAPSGDEFDRHAESMNRLFERAQGLMDGMRFIGEAVAHDIRTPLTRLRNRLDRLHDAAPEGAVREEAAACVTEADQLLATFAALLRIARIESGSVPRVDERVELPQLAADAIDFYLPPAEERDVRFASALADCTVFGDRNLLFQLLANLLDNAVRFAPPASTIVVSTGIEAGRRFLCVVDHGPGVAEAERERVFDRFYRLDRSRGGSGAGLGLSLVKAIADLHGATVTLSDAGPGLQVLIEFPAPDGRA